MTDLMQAKQILSARLLRAGLHAEVVGRRPTLSVRNAVASASQTVHAVGIGPKIVEGRVTSQMCVRIYVVQKLAPSLVPMSSKLPESIDGVPTDIIESAPAFIQPRARGRSTVAAAASCTDTRRKNQRPVIAGISTAHIDVTAGTISYFCRSTLHGDDPSKVYILSNNHVLANVNQAHEGDDLLQPGPADGGLGGDHVAEFHRFVPLQLGGVLPNKVDAAIGELLPGIQHKLEVCGIGKITGTATATQDMLVRKHGRTTGRTEGSVSDASVDALVGMDHNDPSIVALFQEQMRIERVPPFMAFGLGGDSGSLVVNQSKAEAVGLYFAGPEDGIYGLANHIADVISELQIELL